MKIKVLIAAAVIGLAPVSAIAGMAWVPLDPEPEVSSSEGDIMPALILLGLIGMVIAGTQMGGMATRGEQTMLPGAPVDE